MGEVYPLFYLPMIDKLREIIEPILQKEEIELVEIIYRREGRRQVLRLLVDREGGIKLSECIELNKRISQIMEEADIITESYTVEVASPGIDRAFKTKRDYERAKERMIRVTLNEAILDKKEYIARLEEILDDSIKIDIKKKGIVEVPFAKITRARQEPKF